MAGRGRKVSFHGAFGSKAAAVRKERRVRGGYVRRVRIQRKTRWLVLKRKGRS